MGMYPPVHPLIKIGLVLSSPVNDSPIPSRRADTSVRVPTTYDRRVYRRVRDVIDYSFSSCTSPHSFTINPLLPPPNLSVLLCNLSGTLNSWKHRLKAGLFPSPLHHRLSYILALSPQFSSSSPFFFHSIDLWSRYAGNVFNRSTATMGTTEDHVSLWFMAVVLNLSSSEASSGYCEFLTRGSSRFSNKE